MDEQLGLFNFYVVDDGKQMCVWVGPGRFQHVVLQVRDGQLCATSVRDEMGKLIPGREIQ